MSRSARRGRRACVVAVSAISLLLASPGVADAATGGNFILGQANTATTPTTLTGTIDGPVLSLTNQSTGASVTGLRVTVPQGKPPLTVTSSTKVAKLNADLIDGLEGAAFQKKLKGSCADGTSVQAIAPDGTVTCEGTSANADTLDGLDSSSFTQGAGENVKGAAAIPAGTTYAVIFLEIRNPDFLFVYKCPADLATNGVLFFLNDSPDTVNVFVDNGSTNPEYASVAGNGSLSRFASAGGEHFTFQIQGAQITTAQIFSVHRTSSNDCHTQGQALVSR